MLLVLFFVFQVAFAYNGRMTWYRTGLNACGYVNYDGDPIVAVRDLGTGPYQCGTKIKISYGGVTAIAYIADQCRNCVDYHIDASPGLFLLFAPLGELQVDWQFTDDTPTLIADGECGGLIQCSSAQVYCTGSCVNLPKLDQTDILAGGPGFAYEQCSGPGFAVPLVCPQSFSCIDMGGYGRPGYGQCLPLDAAIVSRPQYLEVNTGSGGKPPLTLVPKASPTTSTVVEVSSSSPSIYVEEASAIVKSTSGTSTSFSNVVSTVTRVIIGVSTAPMITPTTSATSRRIYSSDIGHVSGDFKATTLTVTHTVVGSRPEPIKVPGKCVRKRN